MNITVEEKIMYEVMKAIYDSGIPISFKGSMVLKAFLSEAGFSDDTRHTVDIDANWNSDDFPTTEQIAKSLQKAIDKSKLNLTVNAYRKYGENRSAGFELIEPKSQELLFTMDIDVNRPVVDTKIYEISGIHFRGVSPSQMIADKITVVSSEKIFRRIKDLVDLYYISRVFELDKSSIIKNMDRIGRKIGDFDAFLNKTDELRHSYEKFRFSGGVNKPSFDEVYESVKAFLFDLK